MKKKLFLAAALSAAATPCTAATYIDTVNSFLGGTGYGVFDNSPSYTGPSGPGTFSAAAVTSFDGAGIALGGKTGTPGRIVVSFSSGAVIDGAGADFRTFDTIGVTEGIAVEASQDGVAYFNVGTTAGNFAQSCSFALPCASSFDLSSAGLSSARFFRLTAVQGAGCVQNYPECYDFDTLEAINFASGAVPEPSTWALLILGFGAVGGAMRRRTRSAAQVRTSIRFA